MPLFDVYPYYLVKNRLNSSQDSLQHLIAGTRASRQIKVLSLLIGRRALYIHPGREARGKDSDH